MGKRLNLRLHENRSHFIGLQLLLLPFFSGLVSRAAVSCGYRLWRPE